MAVLGGERSVTIFYKGQDVTFKLRDATEEEIVCFMKSRWPVKRNKPVDNSVNARAEFFDKLFISVSNLKKPNGEPVSKEDLGLLPVTMKTSIVFELYESLEVTEDENSIEVLGGDRSVTIFYKGEDVSFKLREPFNEETACFLQSRWPIRRNAPVDNSIKARMEFFDKLFISADNLTRQDGEPVTKEDIGLIPPNIKTSVIYELFEGAEADEDKIVKN